MMTFKQKRQYKRRAKLYMRLAYVFVAIFVLGTATAIWYVTKYDRPIIEPGNDAQALVFFVSLFVGLPFTGLMFAMLSSLQSNARRHYYATIKNYREKKFFITIIDMLGGDVKVAIPYYNSMPEGRLKDYAYAMMINEFNHSDDPILVEQANEKLEKLRKANDPNTVEV